MTSTNFEFLRRGTWSELVDDAENAENCVHRYPRSALRDLRTFCESLLKIQFNRQTDTLGKFLNGEASRMVKDSLPGELFERLEEFGKYKVANSAAHYTSGKPDPVLDTEAACVHLKTAFDLAVWFVEQQTGERPDLTYVEPPHGGWERDELEKQHGKRPQDLRGWIDTTLERGAEPAADDEFIGRETLIRRIHEELSAGQQRILIAGEPGRGKTRLLQELSARGILKEFGDVFECFFRGTSQRDRRSWLKHFYASVLQRFGLEEFDQAIHRPDLDELQNRFCSRLREICGDSEPPRLIFVIDAIDEAGDAESDVLHFLRNRLPTLPKQVTFVATIRRGHLPDELIDIDLEDPDQLNGHRTDGRSYVESRLGGLGFPNSLMDEMARVGNGNFCALHHICHQVRAFRSHEEIREYLDSLKGNPDVLQAVYKEWWSRLETRVQSRERSRLVRIAALIAAAHAPISDEILETILDEASTDLRDAGIQLQEYLTTPGQSGTYRFYHATFAAFIRTEFPSQIRKATKKLADFCFDWKHTDGEPYSKEYTLRFCVRSLIETERWKDLAGLLTDLAFIEARFAAGHDEELLSDFDAALEAHPDSRERIQRRTDASERWVREIVEYSRKCTGIRERHAAGTLKDPAAEIAKLSLPELPDTHEVEGMMGNADYRGRSGALAVGETGNSDRIHEWRGFVNRWLYYLSAFPRLTVSIARKHGTVDVVRTATGIQSAGPDYLFPTGDSEPAVHNSLVLHEIVDHLPDAGGHFGGMTWNAAVVFGARAPSTYLWERKTGRRLDWHDEMLCICPDGAFAVFERPESADNPHSIYVGELTTERIVAQLSDVKPLVYWPDDSLQLTVTMQMTPDVSTLAFIDGHDSDEQLTSLGVWSPWNDDVFRFEIDDLSPQRVYLAPSGTVAAVLSVQDGNTMWRFFDLIGREKITDVSADDFANYFKQQSFAGDMRLAARLQNPLCSIDDRITIQQDPDSARYRLSTSELLNRVDILVGEDVVRSFGMERPFDRILGLSADGRLAFATTPHGFALLDLAEGVCRNPMADDGRALTDTDHPAPPIEDVAACPTLEEEAVLLEMGVAASGWGRGVEGTLVLSSETARRQEQKESLADADSLFGDWATLLASLAAAPPCMGLRRLCDQQMLCKFADGWDPIVTVDGSRWSLDASDVAGQEQIRRVVDLVAGTTSTLSGAGKPLAWTRDGKLLITAEEKTGLSFWRSADLTKAGGVAVSMQDLDLSFRVRPTGSQDSSPAGPFLEASPDGRYFAWCGYYEAPTIVAIKTGARTEFPDVTWAGGNELKFSADGRFVITTFQMYDGSTGGHFLWDVRSGECLDLIAGDSDIEGVRVSAPEPIIPWVTGVRIFRPESAPARENLHEPLYPDGRIPGRFDEDITYRCPDCGRWSPLPTGTHDCIHRIHHRARLSSEDSPILKLPDQAWLEPGLSVECPICHRQLKSTPFVVDRQAEPR